MTRHNLSDSSIAYTFFYSLNKFLMQSMFWMLFIIYAIQMLFLMK